MMVQHRSEPSCTMWSQCHNARLSQTTDEGRANSARRLRHCPLKSQSMLVRAEYCKSTENDHLPLPLDVRMEKVFQLQEASPPDPPPGALPLGSLLGAPSPESPVIGSSYHATARHSRLPPPPLQISFRRPWNQSPTDSINVKYVS